jgi:hypothetical protein
VRNRAFREAIKDAILIQKRKKAEVIVVDAWAGTGILGIFALLLGADKVYFLEQNHHSLLLVKHVLLHLGLSKNAQLIHCDATKTSIPESFNILISETLSSWFIEEDFPFIMQNMLHYAHPDAILLPEWFLLDRQELWENYNPLAQSTLILNSKNLSPKQKLILTHPDTHYIKFSMHAKMWGWRIIKSGSTMSFLNPRIRDISLEHQFFEIER